MNYQSDLSAARLHLVELLAKRENLEIEIAQQKEKVAALSKLTNESGDAEQLLEFNAGLTEACKTAFRIAPQRGLSVEGIKSVLEFLGFPIEEYKNVEASIHTTVKRMQDKGEVES